VAAGLVF